VNCALKIISYTPTSVFLSTAIDWRGRSSSQSHSLADSMHRCSDDDLRLPIHLWSIYYAPTHKKRDEVTATACCAVLGYNLESDSHKPARKTQRDHSYCAS